MFQVGACVQADAAAAAEAGTLQQRWPGNDISGRCNSENDSALSRRSVTHKVGKFSLGLSQDVSGVKPCARAVLYSETISSTTACSASPSLSLSPARAAAAGAVTLRDRQIVTSPHDNSAGMERAISRKNNFGGNIAEAKSKLRCEHHRLSHRRMVRASSLLQLMNGNLIRDGVFSQYRSGNQSEEASNCGTDEDRKTGLRPVRQTVSAC
jgi:hypothetical protein